MNDQFEFKTPNAVVGKLRNSSGPLITNDAPTWMIDTAATIVEPNGLNTDFPGVSVFNLDSGKLRGRGFYYYEYQGSEWTDNHLEPIHEFSVSGSVLDSLSWQHKATYNFNGETLPRHKKTLYLLRFLTNKYSN